MMPGHAMKAMLLLTVLCSAAVKMPAQIASSEGTAAAIRLLEQQWTVGQARNDNAALDLIFDNALVYVEYGKLVSKSEYLARIKHAEPQEDQIELQPMSVHLFGSTAIVVGVYAEKQQQGNGREAGRWRFVDTWVYKNNRWVLVAAGSSRIVD
jgi:hypothetical protein